jgi:hypothetical protein
MDVAAIERFSGPPLAERAYVSEQARACVVRPGTDDLDTIVQRDLRGREGTLVWDSWRRADGRWTVVAGLGEDPVSTWLYDPRSRSVQPDDAASHRLASEDVVVPLRPSTSTVTLPREQAETSPADPEDNDQGSPADEGPAEAPPADLAPTPAEPVAPPVEGARSKSRKGRRASVPRWDEILFGAGQADS